MTAVEAGEFAVTCSTDETTTLADSPAGRAHFHPAAVTTPAARSRSAAAWLARPSPSVVEVYTPSGNWSSYPGHKHDVHIEDADGNLAEADLEEVYLQDRLPGGLRLPGAYTDSIAAAPGRLPNRCPRACQTTAPHSCPKAITRLSALAYDHYLNVLAGAQSLANQTTAPRLVKTYTGRPTPLY